MFPTTLTPPTQLTHQHKPIFLLKKPIISTPLDSTTEIPVGTQVPSRGPAAGNTRTAISIMATIIIRTPWPSAPVPFPPRSPRTTKVTKRAQKRSRESRERKKKQKKTRTRKLIFFVSQSPKNRQWIKEIDGLLKSSFLPPSLQPEHKNTPEANSFPHTCESPSGVVTVFSKFPKWREGFWF